jgi:hypothetical protein
VASSTRICSILAAGLVSVLGLLAPVASAEAGGAPKASP